MKKTIKAWAAITKRGRLVEIDRTRADLSFFLKPDLEHEAAADKIVPITITYHY